MACEVCHKVYIPTADNQTDSDAKPHLCTTCGHSFSLKIQLKRHTLLHADRAPYTCKNCAKASDKMEIKTYNLRLGSKNDYTCDICQKSFSNKRILLRHSIQHTFDRISDNEDSNDKIEKTVPPKKFVASQKPKNPPRRSSNKRTESQSVSKSPRTLYCQSCDKGFAYQGSLDKHLIKGCNVSKSAVTKSSSNTNSSEVDSKKHVCTICNKTFARKSALDGHEFSHILDKVTSDEEKGFSDEGESDEYVSQPKKPRKSEFKFQRSYTCEKCNFVCFSKQTLNKHLENHKEVSDVKREKYSNAENGAGDYSDTTDAGKYEESNREKQKVGEKKLKSEENSNEHTIKGKERNFVCEICDKKFYQKKALKRHLLFHVARGSGDFPSDKQIKWGNQRGQRSKKYVCEICGRRFAGETCLKKHALKHDQEKEDDETDHAQPSNVRVKKPKTVKEMKCEFCGEEFTGKKSVYVKHIHAHTPEVCGICDQRFVDRQSLREHCKIHVGTEEGRMFMQCSQKALDAKNCAVQQPEPKVEYIYLVLR